MSKRIEGFSLIEISMALIIIGLLTMITISNYSPHLIKSKRHEAKLALLNLSACMEKYFFEYHTYKNITLETCHTSSSIANQHYRLSIDKNDDTDYLLAATPSAKQKKQDGDCGILTLNSKGIKHASGHKGEACWN